MISEGVIPVVDCNNHVKSTAAFFGESCAVNTLQDRWPLSIEKGGANLFIFPSTYICLPIQVYLYGDENIWKHCSPFEDLQILGMLLSTSHIIPHTTLSNE